MDGWETLGILLQLLQLVVAATGSCTFPDFLHEPVPGTGNKRVWVTETLYTDNDSRWQSQTEIIVKHKHLTAKKVFEGECPSYGSNCRQRQVLYTEHCLSAHGKDTFFMSHHKNGEELYRCIRFVPINKNIIQVWRSVLKTEKDAALCHGSMLHRDGWPWVSIIKAEWKMCPFDGGLDFRLARPNGQPYCDDDFRMGHMESECIRGEGLQVSFASSHCSPMDNKRIELQLYCWGDWEEGDYQFILTGERSDSPRLMFRLPKNWKHTRAFEGMVYFSPVAPLGREGFPSGNLGILHLILKLSRAEPGLCYDESDHCVRLKQKRKCNSRHELRNYCMQSCGLCNLMRSNHAECEFPSHFTGTYYWFEDKTREEVTIDKDGLIFFSTLGRFICKGKHWQLDKNMYKLMSYYDNGCRPRYTCINFASPGEESDIIRFQLSRSRRKDSTFDGLCHFADDPKPLAGTIRSGHLKTLISAKSRPRNDRPGCGLSGVLVNVNVNLTSMGLSCPATLQDWDAMQCKARDRLSLGITSCQHKITLRKEYQCLAYAKVQTGTSILITRDLDDEEDFSFNCWIVHTYGERMDYAPWRLAYQLNKAQCGSEWDLDPKNNLKPKLVINVPSDRRERPCSRQGPRLQVPTPVGPIQAGVIDEESNSKQNFYLHMPSSAPSQGLPCAYCVNLLVLIAVYITLWRT